MSNYPYTWLLDLYAESNRFKNKVVNFVVFSTQFELQRLVALRFIQLYAVGKRNSYACHEQEECYKQQSKLLNMLFM